MNLDIKFSIHKKISLNKRQISKLSLRTITTFFIYFFSLVYLLYNQYPITIGSKTNNAKAATTKFGTITQCPPSGPCVLGANTSVAAPYQDIGGNAAVTGNFYWGGATPQELLQADSGGV